MAQEKETAVADHYKVNSLAEKILDALQRSGLDLDALTPVDRAPGDEVHMVQQQMDVMGIQLGHFQRINLSTTIKANGNLDLPPQNQASVLR